TRKFGADRPLTVLSRNNLGLVYVAQGRLDQAEPHFLFVLENNLSRHGESHPRTLSIKSYLAGLYHQQQKYEQAARLYGEALAKPGDNPGPNASALLFWENLAGAGRGAKQLDQALPLVEEFVSRHNEIPSVGRPYYTSTLVTIAQLLMKSE